MNVVFIVTSYWSYGELIIAIEFAKEIRSKGYNPYFFIPPTHKEYVESFKLPYSMLIPKSRNINRILFQDYENNYKPAIIILSDFLNYANCEKFYGLKIEDLEIFKGKKGTFDNFDWDFGKRTMDVYGCLSKGVIDIDINNFGFKLTPCPIANALNDKCSKDHYYYKLSQNNIDYKYNLSYKKQIRKELGLPENKNIIFTTTAKWQHACKDYEDVIEFVELMNDRYYTLLSEASEDGVIINVGGQSNKTTEKYKNIINVSDLKSDDFNKYIMASDLYVTRNITSTTLVKLALSGVPCLSLVNSYSILNGFIKNNDEEISLLDKDIMDEFLKAKKVYPYRMFPVGWHRYLKPIVKDNLYYKHIVPEIEILHKNCVEKIKEQIFDLEIREKRLNSIQLLNSVLGKLKEPHEILDIINN